MTKKKIDLAITAAASALGRLGGLSRSARKRAASRRNANLAIAKRWPKKEP